MSWQVKLILSLIAGLIGYELLAWMSQGFDGWDWPTITEIRALIALMERAMSSAKPMTRLDLMPGAGASS